MLSKDAETVAFLEEANRGIQEYLEDARAAGRIDQHAMALEGEIVEEMFAGDTFGGDGDDDGDDDDDDGDGEDE